MIKSLMVLVILVLVFAVVDIAIFLGNKYYDAHKMSIVHCGDEFYSINKPTQTTNEQDNLLMLLNFSNRLQKENQELSDRVKRLEDVNNMRSITSHYQIKIMRTMNATSTNVLIYNGNMLLASIDRKKQQVIYYDHLDIASADYCFGYHFKEVTPKEDCPIQTMQDMLFIEKHLAIFFEIVVDR